MARLLVLDAQAELRHCLYDVLEEAGYQVVEAHNSYEGSQHGGALPLPGDSADILYLVVSGGEQVYAHLPSWSA